MSITPETLLAEGYKTFPAGDDFLGLIGPLYVKRETDGYRIGLIIEQRHSNPMGVAHGGLMVTLADMVLGLGCGFVTGIRFPHPTVSLNSDFVRGPKLGQFVSGKARVARRTRNFIFTGCELEADGEVMLTATGIFKVPELERVPEQFRPRPKPAAAS